MVAGIEAKGGKASPIQADMSNVADVGRLVKDTVKKFGRLDILVNNAGKFMYKPLVETTEEEFDRMFALNTKGPYFALQEAAKVIMEGGRLVNISTDGTHIGFGGATAYLGSKGALEQFTKGLAHELGAKGDHREHGLSGLYTVTAMLPADPKFRQMGDAGLAAQATRHAEGHRRRRRVCRERGGAVADWTEPSCRWRRGDVRVR